MADGSMLETVLSSQQMQHALNEATWAARLLLHVDASIVFLAIDQAWRATAWHGLEAGELVLSPQNLSIRALRTGRRSIAWVNHEQYTDPEMAALLEGMGLRSGLLVPISFNSDLAGVWLVATTTERLFNESDELILHTLAENIGLTTESLLLSAENLRYRREADALYEIGKEISQLLDLDRVLEVIAEKARLLLNAEISYIALADDAAQVLRVRVTKGTYGDALRRMVLKYGEGVGGYVALTRTPLLLDNYPADSRPKPPGIAEIVATEGIISVICVPMSTRTRLTGVLYVASRREAAFNDSQLNLLSALGTQAAIAIENARLYAEEKVTTEQLRLLNLTLAEERERLRTSMTINERLVKLVLDNQGVQAIANTLSELVHCPVVVEDSRFRVLCWSVQGYEGLDQWEMRSLHTSSLDLWQEPSLREQLTTLRDARRLVQIPPRPEHRLYHSRLIAPIIAGTTLLGYVSVLEIDQPLSEQQRLAVEQAAIVFALELLKQETVQEVAQRLAGDFLSDLLFGRGATDPAVDQRAARLNVNLHREHRILIFDIDDFAQAIKAHHWSDMEALTIKRLLLRTVSDVVQKNAPGSLVELRGDSVLVLLPERKGLADALALIQQTRDGLRSPLPDLTISVGVGRSVSSLTDLPRSYQDAALALRAMHAMGGRDRVIAFEELGVIPLLLQSEDQQGLVAFMERYLQPLLTYDDRHQAQLLPTLEAFLSQNGNLQRTAESLYIHPNSLKYRLRRIQEITGLDLRQAESRFHLQLALMIRSALGILRNS